MALKTIIRCFLLGALLFAASAAEAAEESLGTKIKEVFEPAPTPTRKHRKKKATPTPSPTPERKQKKASPTPSPSPTPKTKSKRKKASPTPASTESPASTETPSPSPAENPTSSPPERPAPGKKGWPNASLSPDQIADYDHYPPRVRQIIDAGLTLTKQNLGYTYGSADPKNGGMD
ncbi:MAG: hypothetical protein WA496_10335 [Candidatus Udaeobacter sp.]